MEFTGTQKSMTFKQINNAKPEIVFPLLCPVREKDWIDGWDYKMIFSKSGLIEKSCVFSTSHNGKVNTIWYVTEYDRKNFRIEFLRITANEEIVKININLKDNGNKTTTSEITYQYTGLNDTKNSWIYNRAESQFRASMVLWEKSINHYIETGEKLMR